MDQKYKEKVRLCKDCVNFLVDENTGKVDCDILSFKSTSIYRAILFVPELFDCEEWEYIEHDE